MNKQKWYDNPKFISNLLIAFLLLIIIISQYTVTKQQLGNGGIVNILFNYNIVYLLYFILLSTKFGKRNFNILNIILIIMQLLITINSIFNIFQMITLSYILSIILNVGVLIYLVKSMFDDTLLWKKVGLNKTIVDQISNESYFNSISTILLVYLVIDIFSKVNFVQVVLSLLRTIFMIGFVRYLYLYQNYKKAKNQELEQESEIDKIPTPKVYVPPKKTKNNKKQKSRKKAE